MPAQVRPVPGYPEYTIDTNAVIRRLSFVDLSSNRRTERVVAKQTNSFQSLSGACITDSPYVSLNGKRLSTAVVMAMTFLNFDPDYVIIFRDGNAKNCALENLYVEHKTISKLRRIIDSEPNREQQNETPHII